MSGGVIVIKTGTSIEWLITAREVADFSTQKITFTDGHIEHVELPTGAVLYNLQYIEITFKITGTAGYVLTSTSDNIIIPNKDDGTPDYEKGQFIVKIDNNIIPSNIVPYNCEFTFVVKDANGNTIETIKSTNIPIMVEG